MNETQILLIVSSITALTSLVLLIVSIVTRKRINMVRDQIFMTLIKCDDIQKHIKYIMDTAEEKDETMMNALSYIADTVESLSSSNEMVLRKMQALQQQQAQHQQKIYPRPQVANEITATIKEQIQMELIKSRKLKAPRADYLNNIIENVAKTYPDVAIDYIANKCVAIIESMGSGGPPREQ